MNRHRDKAPDRDKMIELRFEKNMTRDEIAEHFDVSIATVRRWIKEMDVPRPSRQPRARKPKNLPNPAESVTRLGDGYNRMERAKMKLGGRLIEKRGYGYFLDGRPASYEVIFAAAEV